MAPSLPGLPEYHSLFAIGSKIDVTFNIANTRLFALEIGAAGIPIHLNSIFTNQRNVADV